MAPPSMTLISTELLENSYPKIDSSFIVILNYKKHNFIEFRTALANDDNKNNLDMFA
jgi:hypothetical protein